MKIKNVKAAVAMSIVVTALAFFQPVLRAQESARVSRSAWDGVYTKDQSKRGEGLYAQSCSSCHGPDLLGNDEAAPLAGSGFLSNWDGLTIGDLSERVRVSMPPNQPGRLSRQQIADILSYVLSFNSFPSGKAELDPKVEVLKQIRIEATKPRLNSNKGPIQ